MRAVETWKGRSGEGRHGDAEGPASEWGVNEKGKGPATVSVTLDLCSESKRLLQELELTLKFSGAS